MSSRSWSESYREGGQDGDCCRFLLPSAWACREAGLSSPAGSLLLVLCPQSASCLSVCSLPPKHSSEGHTCSYNRQHLIPAGTWHTRKHAGIEWKMDVSLCSQRLRTQPEFLTCSRGWARCEAARLGGGQGISSGHGSHGHLCGYVWVVFAGWEELGSPAARAPSILCKCSCLSELPASSRSRRTCRAGWAPRASWACFSSALTQERFSRRPGGLTDNAWPFTFGHVVGVQLEVLRELHCRL